MREVVGEAAGVAAGPLAEFSDLDGVLPAYVAGSAVFRVPTLCLRTLGGPLSLPDSAPNWSDGSLCDS
eukprot:3316447-Alexandrium_andersonii.AAC.1